MANWPSVFNIIHLRLLPYSVISSSYWFVAHGIRPLLRPNPHIYTIWHCFCQCTNVQVRALFGILLESRYLNKSCEFLLTSAHLSNFQISKLITLIKLAASNRRSIDVEYAKILELLSGGWTTIHNSCLSGLDWLQV